MRTLRLSPLLVLTLTTVTTLNLLGPVRAAEESNDSSVVPTVSLSLEERERQRLFVEQGEIFAQTEPAPQNEQKDAQPAPPEEKPQPTPSPEIIPKGSDPTTESRVLVVEVVVLGVEGELKDLVYQNIRTVPGRTTTRSQLQQDVNAIYSTGFFGNIKITPVDTPLGVRIVFDVQPNPILKEVKVDIVPGGAKKDILPVNLVNEIFSPEYGKILNWKDLQEGIKKLNEWYSKNGYELAQVIDAPKVSEEGVVTLVISEGLIEDIQVKFFNSSEDPVEGKTRDFIITREIELKPGDIFNRKLAQQDLQRVYGLGLFEDVKLAFSPGKDPRKVIISVNVVEGKTGSLGAGAGYSSDAGIFGTISYQDQNIGGNNQTLGLEFQGSFQQLLFNASFSDPWIATEPNRLSYTANLFRSASISLVFTGDNSSLRTANNFSDPRVIRTGFGLTFGIPIAENVYTKPDWRLSTGFIYQNVQVQDDDGNISPFSLPLNGFPSQPLSSSPSGTDNIFILSLSASQDSRNNPLQPTSGSSLRLGLDQSVPIGSGNIFFTRIRANYSYYIPLKLLDFEFTQGPQALAFNIQGGAILGDFPPYEAFVVGGSSSVRGYADGEVGSGRYYFQATAEYRFPIFAIVGGAIFFDYGTTLGSGNQVTGFPSIIRGLPGSGYGYGIGVRIQSPVGAIRIDYGIPEQGNGRIQFGIGERF